MKVKVRQWGLLVIGLVLVVSGVVIALLDQLPSIEDSPQASILSRLPSGEEPIVKSIITGKDNSAPPVYNIDDYDKFLVIPKMGVAAPILEGGIERLAEGIWLLPDTSTPDQGGNTVITAHRWKYKPPDPRTFYNIDKMQAGDVITLKWKGKKYYYQVFSVFIVTPDQTEILYPTKDPILTLFSCAPLYETTFRQVVQAKLIKTEEI